MNLSVHYPPHIRTRDSSLGMMFDAIVAMLPLYGMSTYFYGPRCLVLALISVISCLASDYICSVMMGKGISIRDISPVVTGLIIPLLLPASAGYHMVITAGLFAILVVKQPFGGLGQNIFNPAAGGIAFVTVCWPTAMFSYPRPFITLPLTPVVDTALERSIAYSLSLGGLPTADYLDMALGNVPGPMGTTHILVLFACMFYLWVRRGVKIGVTGGFILGAAVFALLFPRGALSPFQSVAYELMSGSLLFAAIFLMSDPVTSPKRPIARTLYGVAGGALCMFFRHLGRLEESVIFGILIMNAFVWLLDTRVERIYHRYRREGREQDKPEEVPEA